MPVPDTATAVTRTNDEALPFTAEDVMRTRELRYDALPPWGFEHPPVPELTSAQRLRRAIARYEGTIEVNQLLIEDCRANTIRFPWQAHHMAREIARLNAGNEDLAIRLNAHRAALAKLHEDWGAA